MGVDIGAFGLLLGGSLAAASGLQLGVTNRKERKHKEFLQAALAKAQLHLEVVKGARGRRLNGLLAELEGVRSALRSAESKNLQWCLLREASARTEECLRDTLAQSEHGADLAAKRQQAEALQREATAREEEIRLVRGQLAQAIQRERRRDQPVCAPEGISSESGGDPRAAAVRPCSGTGESDMQEKLVAKADSSNPAEHIHPAALAQASRPESEAVRVPEASLQLEDLQQEGQGGEDNIGPPAAGSQSRQVLWDEPESGSVEGPLLATQPQGASMELIAPAAHGLQQKGPGSEDNKGPPAAGFELESGAPSQAASVPSGTDSWSLGAKGGGMLKADNTEGPRATHMQSQPRSHPRSTSHIQGRSDSGVHAESWGHDGYEELLAEERQAQGVMGPSHAPRRFVRQPAGNGPPPANAMPLGQRQSFGRMGCISTLAQPDARRHSSAATFRMQDAGGASRASSAPVLSYAEQAEVGCGLRLPADSLLDAQLQQQVAADKGFTSTMRTAGQDINLMEGLIVHKGFLTQEEQTRVVSLARGWIADGTQRKLRPDTYIKSGGGPSGDSRIRPCTVVDPLPPILQALAKRLVRWGILGQDAVPDAAAVDVYRPGMCVPPHTELRDWDGPLATVFLLSQQRVRLASKLAPRGRGNFIATCGNAVDIPAPPGSVMVLAGNAADTAQKCIPAVDDHFITVTFRK
ncbi:hypothetical protein WJX73_003146 [Symbiochloris irregularis]|uniref:Alpha-ketoglutarate-dependent dioxygenase AlkB-like domain-containing protein n=1 Tax=Symbiochloris irregularis TaxID=706552 RepID=A0AAW1PBY1_9CHLO